MALSLHFDRYPGKDNSPSAPALIILHGLFGFSGNWRSIARSLSNDRDVLCVDLRNHGQSPWNDAMDYSSMADDIAELIRVNDLVDPVLLGHSMGGKTVMALMLETRISLTAAVVVDIAPVTYEHDHIDLINTMLAVDFSIIANRGEVDESLKRTIPDAGLRGFLMQNVVRGDDSDKYPYRWRIHLEGIKRNMDALTGFPSTEGADERPVLFVRGGKSPYMASQHIPAVERLFPNAEVRTIENAGHWPHAEQPRALLDLVQDFLARVK